MNKIRLVSFRFDGRLQGAKVQMGFHLWAGCGGKFWVRGTPIHIYSEIPAAGRGKSVAVALAKHCTKSMQLHERGSEVWSISLPLFVTLRKNTTFFTTIFYFYYFFLEKQFFLYPKILLVKFLLAQIEKINHIFATEIVLKNIFKNEKKSILG